MKKRWQITELGYNSVLTEGCGWNKVMNEEISCCIASLRCLPLVRTLLDWLMLL